MRPLLLSSALLLLGACSAATEPRPPPQGRFVYPSGIVHRKLPDQPASNGALYVVSANFDRCFDTGSVIAVNLDDVGLPAFGSPVSQEGPQQLTDLKVANDAWVQIDSFGGELALWDSGKNAAGTDTGRLFVPSRSEGSFLHVIDVEGATRLSCKGGSDCFNGAVSLISVPGAVADQPRAQAPIGVTVDQEKAEVWVTHTEAADSPARTGIDPRTYVVRVPASEPSVNDTNFFPVGNATLDFGGTHASALGRRYAYVSGRNYTILQGTLQPAEFLVRLVDRNNRGRVLDPSLEVAYGSLEARGLALNSGETRLYVVARSPDTLIVVDLVGTGTDSPVLTIVDAVPLPDGATDVVVIPREAAVSGPRRGDLVAVSCSGAGVVALYDEEVGQVVAQVSGVGLQPADMAVDQRGTGARLYTSNFGDGRIGVIDIPNLDNPQDARLVAHLGTRMELDPDQGTTVCKEN